MAGITDPDYLAWKAQQVRNGLQSSDQFRGIENYEPFDIARNSFDNPPFSWPAKQYTDITGNQIKVQRGYMRSLITDPRWPVSESSKNRRLFFQFNPTVLVRSVQQTVGAMNPLLQDPAQLAQPVPGTATFGFELLFNREKEVASGTSYAPGEQPSFEDMMVLPNGDAAIASQIGVLADIMVLDTITGQGLSQDMLAAVTEQAKKQAETLIVSREDRIKTLNEEEASSSEAVIEQNDINKLKEKVGSLSDLYNLNIGNQAFLNPLPFRVLFSSLFMVEGVATSVEVQYQKFSATMIPTQCKVIINMYALYIGFARNDTFLTKNLENSFKETKISESNTNTVSTVLKSGIQGFSAELKNDGSANSGGFYAPTDADFFYFKKSETLDESIKQQNLIDPKLVFYIEYLVSTTEFPTDSQLSGSLSVLTELSVSKLKSNTYLKDITLGPALKDLYYGLTDINKYLSYRFCYEMVASLNGSTVSSGIQYLGIVNAGTSWTTNPQFGKIGERTSFVSPTVAKTNYSSGGRK